MNAIQMKTQTALKVSKLKPPGLTPRPEEKRETRPPPASARHAQEPAPDKKLTLVEATIDVGFGNALFIRGQGDGLSWDKGQPLTCVEAAKWVWSTSRARDKVVFKLLLNDQTWCQGEDLVIEAGKQIEVKPTFS